MVEQNKQIAMRGKTLRHGLVAIGKNDEGEILLQFVKNCGTALITTEVKFSEEACSALAQLLNERYDNTVPKEKFDEISKANTENLIKYLDENTTFLRSIDEAREKHPKVFDLVREIASPIATRVELFNALIDFAGKTLKNKNRK